MWRVEGDVDALVLAALSAGRRKDGLWRSTCFEMFMRRPGEAGYREFNVAPCGDWAAYRFEGYREGRRDERAVAVGPVDARRATGLYLLHAEISFDRPETAPAPLEIGLCAVLETRAGETSYWALAHPPGKPDFHHADGFAYSLP